MARWLHLVLSGAALAVAATCALAAGPEVRVADNVYVVPDPKAKVVTLWMVVHAGCRDEEGGQCRGLAHYLEHLMFLGRNPDHEQASARVFAAGQTNAYTTMRATAYYQTAPAREGRAIEDIEKLFALYADRLRGLDVAEDAARRERNVVLQEYNYRRADSPRSTFYARVNRRLQPEHPVSQQVIGTKEDIAGFTLDAVKAFHARWYGVNNVEFVVYGPVTADDVKPLVAKYVDPLPRKAIPKRAWLDARRTFEPLDETIRIADPEFRRPEVLVEKIVRYEDPFPVADGAANTILFDYLNSQIRGSLYDVFVERKKLVANVRVSTTPLGDGVMWLSLSATLEDGTNAEAMKGEFEAYFAELASTGLETAVVERLKRRRANDNIDLEKDPQQTLSGLTGWFSANRSYADWRTRAETMASVSPAMMTPVLRAVVGPGRQLFGILTPR